MIAPTFRDPALERRLDRDGYVHIPGLGTGVLEHAREIHLSNRPRQDVAVGSGYGAREAAADRTWRSRLAPGERWHISMDDGQPSDREQLKAALAPIWDDTAVPLLTGHRFVMMSVLTKFPGADSYLPLHQDPTVVDERSHRSVTAWLALDDIDRRRGNGPMYVLPGSQRCGWEWRGTHTEPSYLSEIEELWDVAVPLDVAAGDVVFMDSRLLHGSPPNATGEPRAAIAGVAAPIDATLVHVVGIEDDRVEVWEVDEQFFDEYSPAALRQQLPSGYPVMDVLYRANPPTTTEALLAQQHFERTRLGRLHAGLARTKRRLLDR